MTRNVMLIGGAAVLALAVPAIAQMAKPDRPATTRAEAETKIRSHFAAMDADKDGFVTATEIGTGRGKKAFEAMDSDTNGSISRAEFDARHAGRGHGMKMGHGGGRLMMMADADKDGRVSQNEAVAGALAMFDRADTDKNGTLTSEERRSARQAMRAAWRAKAGG